MIFKGFFGFAIFYPDFCNQGCSKAGGGGRLVRQGVVPEYSGMS